MTNTTTIKCLRETLLRHPTTTATVNDATLNLNNQNTNIQLIQLRKNYYLSHVYM